MTWGCARRLVGPARHDRRRGRRPPPPSATGLFSESPRPVRPMIARYQWAAHRAPRGQRGSCDENSASIDVRAPAGVPTRDGRTRRGRHDLVRGASGSLGPRRVVSGKGTRRGRIDEVMLNRAAARTGRNVSVFWTQHHQCCDTARQLIVFMSAGLLSMRVLRNSLPDCGSIGTSDSLRRRRHSPFHATAKYLVGMCRSCEAEHVSSSGSADFPVAKSKGCAKLPCQLSLATGNVARLDCGAFLV